MNEFKPKKGMTVTWINPCDAGPNGLFVENYLVRKYGKDGLTINSVEKYADGDYRVTLKKNGNIILMLLQFRLLLMLLLVEVL